MLHGGPGRLSPRDAATVRCRCCQPRMSPLPGWGHLRRLRVFALRSASLRFSMVYDDQSPRCRLHRDAPTIANRRHRVPFSVSAPHLDCVRATSPTPGLDRRADQCRIAGHMSSGEGALLRAAVHVDPRGWLGGARFPTVLVPRSAASRAVHPRSRSARSWVAADSWSRLNGAERG